MNLNYPWIWAGLNQLIRLKFPKVQHLSPDQLSTWLARSDGPSPLLLDTRTEAEYVVSHLPQAQRLDPATDNFDILQPIGRDTPIVTYCSIGYRSAAIATRLQAAGFTNVANLEGSIFRWANQGKPVYRQGQPVAEVHPYSSRWGCLLDKKHHANGFS